MFWLYLLAAVTILAIALRRVVLRQVPLSDEAFSRAVAFEHVHSGIAWIQNDGRVGSMNGSFAGMLNMESKDSIGLDWRDLFAREDLEVLDKAYSRMLLAGKETVAVNGRNALPQGDKPSMEPGFDLLLVAVHDHKMRFVGHHCLVADRRRERTMEAQLRELRRRLAEAEDKLLTRLAPGASQSMAASNRAALVR